jgi:hypothetical protein
MPSDSDRPGRSARAASVPGLLGGALPAPGVRTRRWATDHLRLRSRYDRPRQPWEARPASHRRQKWLLSLALYSPRRKISI